jgi:hypothetical protein
MTFRIHPKQKRSKETLDKSKFVIPVEAGIQKNQGTGFRLPPE